MRERERERSKREREGERDHWCRSGTDCHTDCQRGRYRREQPLLAVYRETHRGTAGEEELKKKKEKEKKTQRGGSL